MLKRHYIVQARVQAVCQQQAMLRTVQHGMTVLECRHLLVGLLCRTLMNMRFLSTYFFSLSRSFRKAAPPSVVSSLPHSSVSPATVLMAHSVPSFCTLRMFSSPCPTSNPEGAPLVVGLQLDFVPTLTLL